jgi:uncharacterized SAM-binding protein YcdF (DUF218 family)
VSRGLGRGAARVGVALLVLYGGLLAWVFRVSRDDQRRPAGAIVVLGAAHYNGRPSPVLRGRLEHALTLYRDGLAPWLVVTGGTHPGDTESEAAVQRRFLLDRGVPDSVVVPLDQGATTGASVAAAAAWMRARRVPSALLVSDGFHLARLRLEAALNDVAAYTTPTPASPIAAGSRREWGFLAGEALKLPVIWLRRWW